MTQLNRIPVVFNQEEHYYTDIRNGNRLSGITSTLIHRLFPDKYAGVPQYIMEQAAKHGTMIHEELELAESIGITPASIEGQNYLKLKEKYGLKYLTSEHTVSDMEHYATNIDVVYDVEENVVDLADYKTTSKLDKESVSWQLSICSYFLRKNNPHIQVRNLYAIWLRGEIAELVELPQHTDEEVQALIEADLKGEPYEYHSILPDYISDNEMSLYSLGRRIKQLQEEYDTIKQEVFNQMQQHGDKSFDTGNVLITYVAPKPRTTFNLNLFKEKCSKLYEKYITTAETIPSLNITLR